MGLDLLERAESEPLVEIASELVDMEYPKSERLARLGSLFSSSQRTIDEPIPRPCQARHQLDLGEADGTVFLVDDKQPAGGR